MRPAVLNGIQRNVVMLGVVSLFNDAASEMIYPLLPLFLTAVLGAGPAALGWIEGVAESTASVLKLASGYASDRMRRRKPWVVGGYLASNLMRPLIGLAGTWPAVLALRFVDRVGKGIRTSPRDALIADSTAPQFHGRAFGLHRAADHSGAVIGPLLASAALIFGADLRSVFLLSIVPGLIALLTLTAGVTEPPRPATVRLLDPPSQPRRAWRAQPVALRRFLAIVFIFTLGNSSDAFLLLRAQRLGVSIALIPILWMWLHIVKMTSALPAGIASDHWGRKHVILAGWFIYAATYAGLAAATAAWQVWLLFGIYGLFFGLTEGTEKALIADLAPADRRGSAFGLYHLAVGVSALPASVLFGWVWQAFGAAAAFGLGAALAFSASLLLALLPLPPGSTMADPTNTAA